MTEKFLLSEDNRNLVEKKIQEAVDAFKGTEVVEIRYFKEYGKFNLSVFIWKKEGVSLNDCETVHNAVSTVLDSFENLFETEYVLNVSSSGLDRQIKSDDDLRRALDTEIEVFEDKKKCHGVLTAFDNENIEIICGGKSQQNKSILRKNITRIQPYIRF